MHKTNVCNDVTFLILDIMTNNLTWRWNVHFKKIAAALLAVANEGCTMVIMHFIIDILVIKGATVL